MSKRILFILALMFSMNRISQAQFVAESVIFDNYVSPSDNDLQNHFYSTFSPMSLTAISTNGITGGCALTSDSSIWGSDNSVYCSKFQALPGACGVSICFKYDTAGIDYFHLERPVSIWLTPNSDWNHYVVATISRNRKFEQITYGWVNPTSPVLPLADGHWYKFSLTTSFTGGVSGNQIDITSSVEDLGTSGLSIPVVVGSLDGTFDDHTVISDSAIAVSVNGTYWGGSRYLDNFAFEGYKSPDSCLTVGINTISSDNNSEFSYTISNNILSVRLDDFKDAELAVSNSSGERIIFSTMKSREERFDLSYFANGIYFLKINSPRKIFTEKFVISK